MALNALPHPNHKETSDKHKMSKILLKRDGGTLYFSKAVNVIINKEWLCKYDKLREAKETS